MNQIMLLPSSEIWSGQLSRATFCRASVASSHWRRRAVSPTGVIAAWCCHSTARSTLTLSREMLAAAETLWATADYFMRRSSRVFVQLLCSP